MSLLHKFCGKNVCPLSSFAAFLESEKMYDKISRTLLWKKLLDSNFSNKFVTAMKSMYNVVKASVRYNSLKSGPILLKVGVKQGDPCSSILCLFY